jgi:limonene-1,2-epoxide hydrolase
MGSPEEDIEVVENFVTAYNALDFDAMIKLLTPDLKFAHFNRGFESSSSEELVETLRTFVNEYLPDRKLGPALRVGSVGGVVYREQMWTGTLVTDLPGFGSAGDAIEQRFCSVFVVCDGIITEYYDYG